MALLAAEVLQPIDTIPLSALSPPSNEGFLDLNGDQYLNWTLTASWLQSTLNRGQLATRGASQSLSLEVAVPLSDLEFYKLNYRGEIYFPLFGDFTLHLRGEVGYGDGYADTSELPFYEHFFAGGFGSVRGYENNTLGPRSTPPAVYSANTAVTGIDENGRPTEFGGPDGRGYGYAIDPLTGKIPVQQFYNEPDPFGGNVLIEGSAEILFPMPFIKDRSSLRSALFFDVGNVFQYQLPRKSGELFWYRCWGITVLCWFGVTWLSGFGPLTFSLAKPLNASPIDEREVFQFTLGRGF